jgi:hypothetical protein
MVAYGTVEPVAGAGGLTDAGWRRLAGALGDGIVNAFGSAGASSFGLTKSTSGRTVTLHLDEFRIQGVHFTPTQATLDLSIPAVTPGSTRTDRLLVRYDPASATDKVTFYVKAGTEVASGTPPFPAILRNVSGVWEIPLYTWTGGNVAASALDYTDMRIFVSQHLHGLARPGLNSELNLGRTDGTQFYDASTGHTWLNTYPGGVSTWTDMDAAVWQDVNIGTTLKAGIAPPQYSIRRGRVNFRGEAGPVSAPWSDGNNKGLGNVPAEAAPSFNRSFPVFLSNLSDGVRRSGWVTVSTSGQLTLDINVPTGVTVGFARLDAISYDLDA